MYKENEIWMIDGYRRIDFTYGFLAKQEEKDRYNPKGRFLSHYYDMFLFMSTYFIGPRFESAPGKFRRVWRKDKNLS